MTREEEMSLLNAIGLFLTRPGNQIDQSQSALHVQCVNYITGKIEELKKAPEED